MQLKRKQTQIEPEDIRKLLGLHFPNLMSEFYEMQNNFFCNHYKSYKSLEISAVLLSLIKNTQLSIVRQREKKLDFDISSDNFFINIEKIHKVSMPKIISVVKLTDIPKETVRRKFNYLIEKKIIYVDRKNKSYRWNLEPNYKEKFSKILDNDINTFSKFNFQLLKKFNLNFPLNEVEAVVKSEFSFFFYHFLECQLEWIKMWQSKLKDINLIFIAIQTLIPTLKYMKVGGKNVNFNIENIYSIIGKINPKYNFIKYSISATSVSQITSIPRPTCIRKLEKLVKLGFLSKDIQTKRYFVNQSTYNRTKNLITK